MIHRLNDLIHRNNRLNPRQRHVRCQHRLNHGKAIALHTGDLHQPGHRITDQSQEILDGKCRGIAHHCRRTASQLNQCARCHPGCGTTLSLAAALSAGNRCILVDDHPDASRRKECTDNRLIRSAMLLTCRIKRRRHNAAGTGRWAGHDPPHNRINLTDPHGICCCRQHLLSHIALLTIVKQPLGIAPRQPADRMLLVLDAALDRSLHHLPVRLHPRKDLIPGPLRIMHLPGNDNLMDWEILFLCHIDELCHRIEIDHSLSPSSRIKWPESQRHSLPHKPHGIPPLPHLPAGHPAP